MQIEFSEHALDQLKERPRISQDMVLETIEKPDKILPSFRGRTLYQKQYSEDTLEVVTVVDSGKMVVITGYFLEDLR